MNCNLNFNFEEHTEKEISMPSSKKGLCLSGVTGKSIYKYLDV